MKRFLLLLIALVCNFIAANVNAQCTAGYTSCSVNWDYLSFFPSAGLGSYTNLASSQTQRFAFGTQRLTMTHNYASGLATGTATTHTGEAGTFATGDDLAFSGNGQITVSFQSGVQNVQFSVHDIDRLQQVNVSSLGNTVTMAKVSGSVLTVVGSGTSSATGTSINTSVATSSTDGTVNVTITGMAPFTTFSITITGSSGTSNDFYLSDISACSAGSFTNNYFEVSKPFTNQASYVLISKDNQVYYTDAATGKAKLLFTAPFGSNDINAMAYDPVKHYVYYIQDNSTPLASNKTLYRYHYDMDTLGVVMSDVTALFPTFDVGVESGGAAFYDGSLYFGVDISSSGTYKCIIWRIDFDAAANPIAASQVFGIDAAGHDWGDFAVAKGMLFNFDGQAGSENYHHQNLYSKAVTVYTPSAANVAKQTGVDWNSNIYSVGDSTASSPFKGVIIRYNENGTLNAASATKVNYNGVQITGQWRDGAEAFKPKVDFGDAPASYDPVSGDPAVAEISATLRLGANSSNEWVTRGQTVPANSDNFDDGMLMGSLVNPSTGSFFTQVIYLNNTGAPATICAWVDFNNNGLFDAGEGQMQTNLPSSPSAQTVFFNWTGVSTTLTEGQYTYVRFRITTMANGMTTANATGFFDEGEVEDYRVAVTTYPLETNLVSFNAVKTVSGEGSSLTWEIANEQEGAVYTVQRSADNRNWKDVKAQKTMAASQYNFYSFIDASPGKGAVYYRLKVTANSNSYYSQVRKLNFATGINISVSPNPALTMASVTFNATTAGSGAIYLFDATGRKVFSQPILVVNGTNKYMVNVSTLQKGLYWLHLEHSANVSVQKLAIDK